MGFFRAPALLRKITLVLVVTAALPLPVRADTATDVPVDIPPQRSAADPSSATQLAPDAVAVTDPDKVRETLDELTVYGRYYDGEDWIEYHLRDGRTAYYEKGCTYPGKWWLENGEVCYAYPNYRNGLPNCFVLFVRPNGAIQFVAFDADGSPYVASSSLKTAPGNDAHLPVSGLSPCLSV